MGLNYNNYQRGPVDEGGLRGYMNGEMKTRAQAYKVCINTCNSCSEMMSDLEGKMKSAKERFSAGYPISEGGTKDKKLAEIDAMSGTIQKIKSDFRDRVAVYTSAMEFYERVRANCESEIAKANEKVKKLEQETTPEGEKKYTSIRVMYTVSGDVVKSQIGANGGEYTTIM